MHRCSHCDAPVTGNSGTSFTKSGKPVCHACAYTEIATNSLHRMAERRRVAELAEANWRASLHHEPFEHLIPLKRPLHEQHMAQSERIPPPEYGPVIRRRNTTATGTRMRMGNHYVVHDDIIGTFERTANRIADNVTQPSTPAGPAVVIVTALRPRKFRD